MRSAVACLLVLAACAGPQPPAPGPSGGAGRLDGTWKLVELTGQPAAPGASASLSFAPEGRLTGSDGCNRFMGTYDASGTALTLTPGGATMMACPEPVMEHARAFEAALAATRVYAADGGRLVLRDADGSTLAILEALRADALPGTRWSAVAVNNGREAVVSLLAGTEITAEFGADGALQGSAGCNRYTTGYTLAGDAIAIRPPALTRRACPELVMAQECEYMDALVRATMLRLDADRLELRDAAGALQVTFQPLP